MAKSNVLNPFWFVWCWLTEHKWHDGGDWLICLRCNHLTKQLHPYPPSASRPGEVIRALERARKEKL